MINFESIVSKIAAGGLSAGVFLFWWPEHVPGEGIEQLVLRGLLWTLAFELLFVAFAPLERIVTAKLNRRTEARRARVRERLLAAPAPARTGGALALACLGLAAPVALLSGAPHELVEEVAPAREVVRHVVVEKPVVRREVIVKRVVVEAQDVDLGAKGATAASSASVRTAATTTTAKKAPAAKKAAPAKRNAPAKTTPAPTTTVADEPAAEAAEKAVATTPAPEPAAATTPAPDAAATTTDAPAADTASAPAAQP